MKLQAQHIGFDNAVAILNQGIQAIDSGDSVMDMQDVRKTDSAAVAVVLALLGGFAPAASRAALRRAAF